MAKNQSINQSINHETKKPVTINSKYDGLKMHDSYISCKEVVKIKPQNNIVIDDINDIFNSGLYEVITKSIIKKLASNPQNFCMKSCLDIVNSGYTQVIFEDIKQAIAIELWTLYNDGLLTIKDGVINFEMYTNSKGDDVNSYVKLYKALYRVLADYTNHSQNDGVIISYDALYCSDDAEKQTAVKNSSSMYMILASYDGGLNDIMRRADFDNFVKYASTHVSSTCMKSFFKVLYGLLDGMKSEEISQKYKLAIATVKRRRKDIKDVYIAWKKDGHGVIISSDNNDNNYGCTTMINTGYKATNNGYFDGVIKSDIKASVNTDFGFDMDYNDFYNVDMADSLQVLEYINKHVFGDGFVMQKDGVLITGKELLKA